MKLAKVQEVDSTIAEILPGDMGSMTLEKARFPCFWNFWPHL